MRFGFLLFLLSLAWFFPHPTAAANMQTVEKAFAQGQAAYKDGRFDEAAAAFTQAAETLSSLKEQDKARAVYGNVAVIRMKQERWQDAYDLYAKALTLPGKPEEGFHIKATDNMVFCAEKMSRHDLKAEAISRLLATKPKLSNADVLNFLSLQGDAYRASERYALACASYEQALKLKAVPQDKRVTLLTGLGLSQGNLGRYDQALTSLSAALRDAEALQQQLAIVESTSNIGIIHWEMGQYAQAVEHLNRARDHAKTFSLRRNEGVDSNNVGLVYKSAGRLREAVSYINTALAIAREVGNQRDEAIALSNRALLFRMIGETRAARTGYAEALGLYRKIAFKEGEASALMGLAKMDMVVDKHYDAALENLNAAIAIYEKLENPGFLAEAYAQLGRLYQLMATLTRTTRDLIFDDREPVESALEPSEALSQSEACYATALSLAEMTGRKEIIWSALHGLAFVERERNNLEAALIGYEQAIDVVLSMKGGEENPDLLLEFLHDKDDLFAEAIDVCSRLYELSGDSILLQKQMEYDEIYRNEVLRAHMRVASLSFDDLDKQTLYDDITQLEARKKKSDTAVRKAAQADTSAAKEEHALASQEAALVAKEFEEKLKLWKSRYPQDAVLFDSYATINIDELRQSLNSEQALVQYIPLEDALVILTATREEMAMTRVDVTYKTLASLIRDEFIANNIEEFGHGNDEEKHYADMFVQLHDLYTYLYAPIAERLHNKPDLYIVTSKYLSYVPFSALIVEKTESGAPRFLVEDKTITLSRLSFLKDSLGKNRKGRSAERSIIAVGDPQHTALEVVLTRLEGASTEAEYAVKTIKESSPTAATKLLRGTEAAKSEWLRSIAESPYSIFYFATHGVPYAEIKYDSSRVRKAVERTIAKGGTTLQKKPIAMFQDFLSFYDSNFTNNSHLNGFLFMGYPDGSENGLLTLKNIQELPDDNFKNASLAVLSACNTAVSYSPKVIKNESVQEDIESAEAARELVEAGWTPGVDQVCLVDTFMKRGFQNVYGTLWFADDATSSRIMSRFIHHVAVMPPAQALREAQLEYLRNPPLDYSTYALHPYFWACGNIFGQ